MNRGRGDLEVALQVGFGGWTAEDEPIGVDEGEILPLLFCEAGSRSGT
jgi:hypothetical protein